MELMSNNNLKSQSLIEEDPNSLSLAFRRRNNAIIFIFLSVIIILALGLATSLFYTMHSISDSHQSLITSPAVRAYYSVASNTPWSLHMFTEIVGIKSDADPNLIFTLSLRAAAKDLDMIIISSFIQPDSDNHEPAYKNCSASLLRDGSDQIRHALAEMRVNPSVEERGEMMESIVAVEENLNSCIDDLRKGGESTDVSDVREKLCIVKAYVRSGEEFLARHDVVMRRFRGETVAGPDYWRRKEVLKNVVISCLSGLYMFFLLCILRVICRFVGVKIPPLGNVLRALFTGAIWKR